ncbi:MAG: D-glycero-beta-D-manno-heptose-1,7-bisphosphate 7-phosphatase [Desulfuromonas sp.]|nr:MAG: D-glycero-beta-D-manno-heptose-1,7-bisphosphate 7-phosphatase [Desulfuromonas sp.]
MNSSRKDTTSRPAVFLDRDGTINVEKDYLYKVEDFEFIPGAPEAIKRLKDAGYLVVVVTNQSGVARGYYTLADVDRLHDHLSASLLSYQTSVDGFYVCPHHPNAGDSELTGDCSCRKPSPGMLLAAACDLNVDLARSWMVGDKLADIEAGLQAGVRPLMVATGYGEKARVAMRYDSVQAFPSIVEAVEHILDLDD